MLYKKKHVGLMGGTYDPNVVGSNPGRGQVDFFIRKMENFVRKHAALHILAM